MLPFLKPRRQDAGVAVIDRKPDEDAPKKDDPNGLRAASSDLIKAVHDRDEEAVEQALRAAFDILDAMPHHEGPHIEE